MKLFASATLIAFALIVSPSLAGGHANWQTVEDQSRVAFGSVKKDTVGEVHHFNKVSGSVDDQGMVALSIDLGSVETNIDIRNERMTKHVFKEGQATATISGEIDMDEMNGLAKGDTAIVDFEGVLSLAGMEVDIEAEMLVARLTETRVLVSTADFIMLSTEDLGINPGIDMLMKLAKLSGITRVTPVAIRVVFENKS